MTDLGRNPEVPRPDEDLPQMQSLNSPKIQESQIQLEGLTILRTRNRVVAGEDNQGQGTARLHVIKIKIPVATDIVLGHEPPAEEESAAEDRTAAAETEETDLEKLRRKSLDFPLMLPDLPSKVLLL
jgi:hypothetical protein